MEKEILEFYKKQVDRNKVVLYLFNNIKIL